MGIKRGAVEVLDDSSCSQLSGPSSQYRQQNMSTYLSPKVKTSRTDKQINSMAQSGRQTQRPSNRTLTMKENPSTSSKEGGNGSS